jgi:hypothetical protein
MTTQTKDLVTQNGSIEALAQSTTPAELLRIAVSQNADIDKLEKLLALQERWERNEARKAFVVAMAKFKADPPDITKNKHVKFGTTEYDHATLDHVCDAVTKGLSQHGISHRWKVDQADASIRVTCILTHDLGHSEETTLHGPADSSGSKNSIQAIGSTLTYLQRYTLLAATGLAAGNSDNDGAGPTNADLISADKVEEQVEWIANARNVDELQKLFRNAYKEASAVNDAGAMAKYIRAKDARRKELH